MKKESAVSYVGERASVVKHEDNLKVEEGAFEGRAEQAAFTHGDRVDVVRHKDNLALEGKMETHRKEFATKGERAEVKRHQDNLKMEGNIKFVLPNQITAIKNVSMPFVTYRYSFIHRF